MRGSRTYGLLSYLYGPGRHEEHQAPHFVASWSVHEADPAAEPEHRRDTALYALARHLDRPVASYAGRVTHHVWHTSVRLAPGDPILNDAQWAHIARRLVAASGVAPEGDREGCRWVAVRHAEDHIHLVATLMRQGPRPQQPNLRGDFYRLRNECRALEQELGLRLTAEADHTAARAPTRAEQAIAHRVRRSRTTSRELLQTKVRDVALAASSESDFFARLGRKPGVSVQLRRQPSGEVVGYAVTLEGNVSADGTQIWYGGSKLAPDLSLPRVRQRWTDLGRPDDISAGKATQHATPAPVRGEPIPRATTAQQTAIAAWQQATVAVHEATAVLQQGGPETAATAAALADLMTVAAGRTPDHVRRQVGVAARHLQRLGREPWKEHNEAAQRTHLAMRAILSAGYMLGQAGSETVAVMALLVSTVLAVRAIAAHQRAQRREAQARVAHLAAEHLQHAAQMLAAGPRTRRDVAAANRADQRNVVRRALSGRVEPEQIVRDPAWPALAGTLQLVQHLGHDPAPVLAAAAGARPLHEGRTSQFRSEAQVLTWRLQRWIVEHGSPHGARHGAVRRAPTSVPSTSQTAPTQPLGAEADDSTLRALVRTALTGQGADPDAVVRDPAWPRLAAALTQITRAGYDAGQTLRAVAGARRLREEDVSPARSEAQVLAWRLQGWLEKAPQATASGRRAAQAQARSGTSAAPAAAGPARSRTARPVSETGVLRTGDDRVFQRAVLAVVEAQECSPALLERLLWVRPDAAADLVARLQSRGVIAPLPGGQSRHRVAIPADELAGLQDAVRQLTMRSRQSASARTTAAAPGMATAHPVVDRPDPRHPRRR
ncbi:hypothetical protein ABZ897_53770 [Nonomuraea sp. NPDC046802]|uniref:hypothetical protein n=1 Tax=Nonomuraea sp. NPDC046802 TaxID=3154919 RepID=UPI0033C07619